jgi:hypothetical protein
MWPALVVDAPYAITLEHVVLGAENHETPVGGLRLFKEKESAKRQTQHLFALNFSCFCLLATALPINELKRTKE